MNRLLQDNKIRPSTEMIDSQYNDPVVTKLNDMFHKLIELSDSHSTSLISANAYFKNKETIAIIRGIDRVISERFGITFIQVSNPGMPYGIIPISPVNYNVISGDIKNIFKAHADYLGKNCKDENCKEVKEKDVLAKNKISIFNAKGMNSVIYHNYTSYLELEKTLNAKGVKVDLSKAKMSNIPSKYSVFIMVDLFYVINVFKMTAGEMVAVLLHEVGHAFTHMENSFRTVRNTTALLDTLRETIDKGESTSRVLNLVYQKVLGGKEDISKLNENVAAIRVINKYITNTMDLDENDNHSATDSEQLADQFSTRFGLGGELVNALKKIHGYTPINKNNLGIVLYSVIVVFSLILSILLIPIGIMLLLTNIIEMIIVGGDSSNKITYDVRANRYRRIRNDIIRVLRTTEMSKVEIDKVLTELAMIDEILNRTNDSKPILERVFGTVLPWNFRASAFKELEEKIENLTENSLHVSANVLKR